MVSKHEIERSLHQVIVPHFGRSIMDLNLVRRIEMTDHTARIVLSDSALSGKARDDLKVEVRKGLVKVDGIDDVEIEFIKSRAGEVNKIGQVIAVMSGKGGVGKSLITGLAALAMSRSGKSVGILDADITGPSIPRIFGIHTRAFGSEIGILPAISRTGIEIMSMNLLLPGEDDAVIWRGSSIAKSIEQFWEEVFWGKLDYLLVDLPPGTADAPLTVMQSIPLSGVIMVFTPQDLTLMIVRKAVKMTRRLGVPILGVVENMSYFLIPGTDKKVDIFGASKAQQMAQICEAPVLARIPIDPELARLCDEGEIETYDSELLKQLQNSLSTALASKSRT